MRKLIAFVFFAALLSSCVSKKKFTELQSRYNDNQVMIEKTSGELKQCTQKRSALEGELRIKENKLNSLQEQVDYLKNTNTNLLDRMSDLSVVSKTGAESIKKSLEALEKQNKYIQDLNTKMQQKDSVNLTLVMNLKRSLNDINDTDIQVEVKKGVVYVSISDKLLFKSGSATINPRAETVLGKVASVINDHKDIDILVEGHTDNVPISNSCLKDNWDLSVKRATAVVRFLQKRYKVKPARLTAGGRSEYAPKASNDTKKGRAANRRTEIIITPKLDQFFKLLESPDSKN